MPPTPAASLSLYRSFAQRLRLATLRLVRSRLSYGTGSVVLALAPGIALAAESVRCHISYAGALRSFMIPAVVSPHEAMPLIEGASFMLKVVYKATPPEETSVKITTYSVHADETWPIHQAHFFPPSLHSTPANMLHGFTGLQIVQEPRRKNELRYWCEYLLD